MSVVWPALIGASRVFLRWVNTMFGELVLELAEAKPDLIFSEGGGSTAP